MLFRLNTDGGLYVTIFFGGLAASSVFLVVGGLAEGSAGWTAIPGTYIGVNILVDKRCSAPGLSYYEGLSAMAGKFISGFVNLTILYIFFLLLLLHFIAAVISLIGLIHGKEWTEITFEKFVDLVA